MKAIRRVVIAGMLAIALGLVQVLSLPTQHASAGEAAGTTSRQIIIRVDGASCPFCAFGLEKRIGRLDGVANVRLEMKEGKVIVTLEEGATVSEDALRQAVDDAGFTPREIIYPESQ